MPVSVTYPGVYIEEIPSGVRTIIGVATSITAFIGRAVQGPTDEPITINSFGDFERRFGGLHLDYPMSYAVRDFYQNGGSQALIVRLFKGASSLGLLKVDTLELQAASAGVWGNNLYAAVDYDGVTADVAARFGLGLTDLFNLTIAEVINGVIARSEKFLNVSLAVASGSRHLKQTLENESNLVRVKDGFTLATRPAESAEVTPPVAGADPPAPPAPTVTTSTGKKRTMTGATAASGKNSEALMAADIQGEPAKKNGLYALEKADLFNLLCIPPDKRDADTATTVYQAAMKYCADRRAMLIVDAPVAWGANKESAASTARDKLPDLNLNGPEARNAAIFFPRVRQADPLSEGRLDTFVPCGMIAGVMARTDTNRGVWKAPAGIDATLSGVQDLQVNLNDLENGMLNQLGLNCLRSFPGAGRVVWGARTLRGADQLADEYKYIPVRRTALFLEETLYRALKWVVFEPNDEPLWAQIRLNVGAFMHDLFRQGAFQGKTPREAYFVKCDKESTTQSDINRGIVNIIVGFAPLKPAEFVIVKLQQMAGQIEV